MKNLMGAAITLAIGMGLAAAAQAQATDNQTNQPAGNMSAPSAAMPNESSGAAMQSGSMGASPQAARHAGRMSRSEIQQAQQQLKQQGLYRGRVDGRMGPETRTALSQFQEKNGLQKTGRLDQQTMASLMNGQTSGVGSSSPNAGAQGMTPSANPNPNAAGDTNNPSGATSPPTGTNPSGSNSKY